MGLVASLTNITLAPEQADRLREALEYYRFENINQFFRVCARTLIYHHENGEKLITPLTFRATHKEPNENLVRSAR
jgi:hypothetical protein